MANVLVQDSSLTAIADAIRGKNGTTNTYKPGEMADAIINLPSGGGGGGNAPTAEELTFSGNLSGLFAYGNWNWFIEKYKNQIKFENVDNTQNMFMSNNSIEDLSAFVIPVNDNTNIQSMFNSCLKLKKLPKVEGKINRYISTLFSNCYYLQDDELINFFKNITVDPTSTSMSYTSMFSNCYSLRNIEEVLDWLHENINTYTGNGTNFAYYSGWFTSCVGLDELVNVPVLYSGTKEQTTNAFSSTFQYCKRAKDITFRLNNGVPYKVRWKSQTIDLSNPYQVGWTSYASDIYNYNSGITKDKEVKDDATYQALKNDPDWYATHSNYSRYNHDSAVNTINSLPDTSEYLATAGGTNTIKFTGTQGIYTDGGAINTLTEEEIAVATAKGWTVSFV